MTEKSYIDNFEANYPEILENIKKYVLPECEQYFDKRILENYKIEN